MQRKTTIKDVAKRAGVAIGTVSRVLNDEEHVSEKSRRLVKEAMYELNYIPNSYARGIRTKSSRMIGVIIADVTNPVFSKIIKGIEDVLQNCGFGIILSDTGMHEENVTATIQLMCEKQVQGIIIIGEHINEEQIRSLTEAQLPVVTVSVQLPLSGASFSKNFASVVINNERAAFCATDYLCRQGCKNIVLILSDPRDKNVGHARYRGYKDALAVNGIAFDEGLICTNDNLTIEAGYQSIQRLVSDQISFDAVFAASDMTAIGAVRALHEIGKSVPEDVSVIGFDGIEQGKYSIPSLTTIDQPRFTMGRESADLLIKMIQGETLLNREVILDFEFIKRESTK